MYNLTVEASYPTPYASSSVLPLILLSMISQKHTPTTTTEIKDAYDYVIVGGGSAGSVVASRLAEMNCVSILILEAGKSPPKLTDMPALARSFIQTDIDWGFLTAPQLYTGNNLVNRRVPMPAGKTIGGGSTINVMINVRGNKKNYDDWAALGADGWNYDSVLHYFKKLENNVDEEFSSNGYHGVNGPVTVSKPPYESELKKAVFEAAVKMGYDIGDSNGPKQTGFYDYQSTLGKGQRCSAAKAYLVPKEKQENLHIVSEAFVKKIIIENQQARGVMFDFKGEARQVKALKEVIIAAGSVNTAQLLMLSGIGPKEELKKHKIPIRADLPVGKNLQDHWAALLPFELNPSMSSYLQKIQDKDNIKSYILNKTGPLASTIGLATVAFLGGDVPNDYPDYQLFFWEAAVGPAAEKQMNMKPEFYETYYKPYENKPFYWCISQVLHPKGTGQVTLQSNNPYDPPIIDPKYNSNPDDLEVIVKGLKKCKEFGLSDSLKKIGSKMFSTTYPGCEDLKYDDDEYFRCISRSMVLTLSHPIGTTKMGNPKDSTTVVDPKLRVKGIHNLRVVDASVMPLIPGGNTNVPTMMVAEKASDLIKQNIQCSV